jgi:hypothetical protein
MFKIGFALLLMILATPVKARSLSWVCEGTVTRYDPTYTAIVVGKKYEEPCLFITNSPEGRKILKTCPLRSQCSVEAAVDNSANAPLGYKIYELMSVHKIGSPALDAKAKSDKEAEDQRRRSAILPYEERTTKCVVGHMLSAPQDAVRDVLDDACARERDALAAEYQKQFGPGGHYLFMDYQKELLGIVDLEKSRAKAK